MKIALTYRKPLNHTSRWLLLIILVLLALWISVLVDQTWNFATFKSAMLRHSFPDWVGRTLAGVLPVAEIAVVALLGNPRTLHYGMWLSSLLMLGFTTYNALGVLTDWVTFECFCSKLINKLSWTGHLWFNLTFLSISVAGIILSRKYLQRSDTAKGGATEGGSA